MKARYLIISLLLVVLSNPLKADSCCPEGQKDCNGTCIDEGDCCETDATGCCSDTEYSYDSEGCCTDGPYDKETEACCGDGTYDLETEGCCQGEKTYDYENLCCGNTGKLLSKTGTWSYETLIKECPDRTKRDGYTATVNGCGDMTSSWIVPQSYFGVVDFTGACNDHDSCYGTCKEDKSTCDSNLASEMEQACKDKIPIAFAVLLGECITQAQIYRAVVSYKGKSAYEEAQSVACQCCE